DPQEPVVALNGVFRQRRIRLRGVALVFDFADFALAELGRQVVGAGAFRRDHDPALVTAEVVDDLVRVLAELIERQAGPPGVVSRLPILRIPRSARDAAHISRAFLPDVLPVCRGCELAIFPRLEDVLVVAGTYS